MNKGKALLITGMLFCLLMFSTGCKTYQASENTATHATAGTGPANRQSDSAGFGDKPYKVENTSKLTMEDIRAKYTDRKIINVINHGDYVLVESKSDYPATASWFHWHNLKTGDMDILPTSPNYVRLVEIINENMMLFEANGKNDIGPYHSFPFYIECYRNEENGGQFDFRDRYIPKYFTVDQGTFFGNKGDEVISDIRITLTGIEILFKPVKGKEDHFYAGFITIPPTKTRYVKDEHQFIIEFEKTRISEEIKNKGLNVAEENYYLHSVELWEESHSSSVVVNLKDKAKLYTADIKKIYDSNSDLPYVQFYFSNNYPYDYPKSETKL
ncbi:MAG: hypothetical protein ACOY31_11215 [Bacillota bacterium]